MDSAKVRLIIDNMRRYIISILSATQNVQDLDIEYSDMDQDDWLELLDGISSDLGQMKKTLEDLRSEIYIGFSYD